MTDLPPIVLTYTESILELAAHYRKTVGLSEQDILCLGVDQTMLCHLDDMLLFENNIFVRPREAA